MSFEPFWRLWILIFWSSATWKCYKYSKIQNSELLIWSKWQFFWASRWPKLISRKIRAAEKNPEIFTCFAQISREIKLHWQKTCQFFHQINFMIFLFFFFRIMARKMSCVWHYQFLSNSSIREIRTFLGTCPHTYLWQL